MEQSGPSKPDAQVQVCVLRSGVGACVVVAVVRARARTHARLRGQRTRRRRCRGRRRAACRDMQQPWQGRRLRKQRTPRRRWQRCPSWAARMPWPRRGSGCRARRRRRRWQPPLPPRRAPPARRPPRGGTQPGAACQQAQQPVRRAPRPCRRRPTTLAATCRLVPRCVRDASCARALRVDCTPSDALRRAPTRCAARPLGRWRARPPRRCAARLQRRWRARRACCALSAQRRGGGVTA